MKKWLIDIIPVLWLILISAFILLCFFTGITLQEDQELSTWQVSIFLFTQCLLTTQILLCLCNRWLPKWYACDGMGWHRRPKDIANIGINGFVQNTGRCPRCNKEVTQDSQGNWF